VLPVTFVTFPIFLILIIPDKHKNIITLLEHKDCDGLVTLKGCKKQEWSKQYIPGNPFQEGQQEDQRHAGRMMFEKTYKSQKCQSRIPMSRIEEDGRNWLRRPKLCIKSCRAIIIRRRIIPDEEYV
jgi:hypothetical protein